MGMIANGSERNGERLVCLFFGNFGDEGGNL